jgi:hypothetical protein
MATEKRLIEVESAWKKAQRIYSDPVLLHVVRNVLDSTPTVDAVEVVHGQWMGGYKNRKGRWLYTKPCCSVCSFEQEGISNYCPNCGADMRERKDNGN